MAGRRRPNHRLVKIHRSYQVEEAAQTLRVHKNTVRNWIKDGLPTVDRKRPFLIHGRDLVRFLSDRRKNSKQPCPAGHIYCVKCRAPRAPAGDIADYLSVSLGWGNLTGLCPDCGNLMYRRVSFTRLGAIRGKLDIAFPKPSARITERNAPSESCDSGT